MNKSYISVWNDASGTWVAAPETAKVHSGSGSASSCTISSASDVASRQGAPLKTAFMPLAMAIGVAMLPGTAAAQAVTGNGGLELCPAGVGGLGSSWGPLSSAVGFMSCAPYGGGNASGDGMSFSLNNAASTDGAWGFNSGQITARVTGYQDGHLELAAETGIYMINDVNMSGNKITALAPGDISSTSTDAVNGAQVYQRTRYFQANSPSSDPSTDARAIGTSSVASGPSSLAIGKNSSAYGANTSAIGTNSVALGAGSVASRSDAVSVGYLSADGKSQYTRQIVNVTAGAAGTDAVNVDQLNAAIASVSGGGGGEVTPNAVTYDTSASTQITLNGGQLYQTNANVANLAANVANITGNVTNTVNNIVNGGGIKYFHANSTLADSTATGANSVAIGGAANATAANSVALGANSVASRANAVSVGAVGAERQIINVANGTNGTDAVNLQQLQAMGANINSSGVVTNSFVAYDDSTKSKVTLGGVGASVPVALTNIAVGQVTSGSKDAINGSQLYGAMTSTAAALGGGSTMSSSGQISKPTYTVAGNSYSGVDSAIGALNAAIATGGNPDGVIYDTTAHSKLTLGGAGSTTPVTIANLAAATSDDQAVNLAQLKAAGLNVDTSGNVTNSFVAYDNLAKGTVTFNAGGAPTQLKNVAAGTDLTDAVNFGQMQSYVAENGGGGGTTNGVSYDDASRGKVTLGGAGSTTPVTLTNVAAGSAATDAVNYSQFSTLESQVNNLANGGAGSSTFVNINTPASGGTAAVASGSDSIAIGNGASATGSESIAIGKNTVTTGNNSVAMGTGASAPNANAVALGANSTTDRDNSVSVGSAGAERQITNVAAGTQGTDAVNLNQLNSAMGNMSNSINNVDRNAAKGIASASALNIVTPYLPGRTTLNAGVANYRGYQSVGLGVSRWNEKGTINYNLGVSTSGGNSTIVRAGIGIVLGN
jgi:autotransporter adhesin